ncbi:hypothetical protein RRG08_008987 [Elysia crispata]|uniref:Uncharacterized protein n=1 Tax=Elysia crispata TaxID=231223 RepID=A0AAE1ATW9_9GAST|nr:hypothetical protein RRG08_008987 [Elysia crispata]
MIVSLVCRHQVPRVRWEERTSHLMRQSCTRLPWAKVRANSYTNNSQTVGFPANGMPADETSAIYGGETAEADSTVAASDTKYWYQFHRFRCSLPRASNPFPKPGSDSSNQRVDLHHGHVTVHSINCEQCSDRTDCSEQRVLKLKWHSSNPNIDTPALGNLRTLIFMVIKDLKGIKKDLAKSQTT